MDPESSAVASALRAQLEVARHVLARDARARSPLVLVDRDALTAQVELWRAHMAGIEPHFAVKTCNAPAVLEHFHALGISFDAATAGEIRLLERLGVPPERVICTHPIRDEEDLAAIARYRPRALVVESAAELRKLQQAGIPARGYSPELFLRLELPFGGLSGKFGVEVAHVHKGEDGALHWRFVTSPARRVFEEARAIERESGARYRAFGLSSHVGTNTTKLDKYRVLLRVFAHVRHRLAERGIEVPLLNLGGGYCDVEKAREDGTTQAAFLAELGALVCEQAARERGVTFLAEPGRILVANAGAVLIGVMHVEERSLLTQADGTYAKVPHLKVQMNDGLYGNLLGERHDEKEWRFVPLRPGGEPFASEVLPAILNGKTCDSWDRMARLRPLPRDLRTGDHLLVPNAGAYTLVTATDFNSAPRAQLCLYGRAAGGALAWRLFDAKGDELPEARPVMGAAAPRSDGIPRAAPRIDLAETQPVSMTRLIGSAAGKVDGELLRPKAIVGDEPSWREALAHVYRNELTLRLAEQRPLSEGALDWRLEVRRDGARSPALLRIGKRPLDPAEAELLGRSASELTDISREAGFVAVEELGILPEGRHAYCFEELADGVSLEDRIVALQRALPARPAGWRRGEPRALLEHVREAALALERAHARGLVHGDVRPANLVVPASGGGVLRVRGWSLVRARIEALDARRPEGTPELSLGPGDDVRGLAGTLHAVLWGHLPRGAKAARAGRDVPAELVSIVGRGLAPRPEQRFRSAAELAEDLRRYLDGEEVRAHRATLSGARAVLYSARSSLLARRRGARADEEERAP